MKKEQNIQELQKPALRVAVVMSRFSPLISITCLIWYFIDKDIQSVYTKTHLITSVVFAIPFILIRLGYLNEP